MSFGGFSHSSCQKRSSSTRMQYFTATYSQRCSTWSFNGLFSKRLLPVFYCVYSLPMFAHFLLLLFFFIPAKSVRAQEEAVTQFCKLFLKTKIKKILV